MIDFRHYYHTKCVSTVMRRTLVTKKVGGFNNMVSSTVRKSGGPESHGPLEVYAYDDSSQTCFSPTFLSCYSPPDRPVLVHQLCASNELVPDRLHSHPTLSSSALLMHLFCSLPHLLLCRFMWTVFLTGSLSFLACITQLRHIPLTAVVSWSSNNLTEAKRD